MKLEIKKRVLRRHATVRRAVDRKGIRAWLAVLLCASGGLGFLLACPAGRAVVSHPDGTDGGPGVDGGAGSAALALEIGDGGLSMGRPGLAMYMGGPRHRGRSLYAGPAHSPDVVWSFRTGARVFASPVVGPDGTIYVGSIDGTFNALSPEGNLRWSYTASAPIFSSAAISATGHIYVGCDDGTFLAFHPSGRVLWSARRDEPFDSSPVIGDDGTIYVGGDGLIAFTPRGGRRWTVRTGSHVFASPVVHPRRLVVFGTGDGALHGVGDDGRVAFRVELEGGVFGGAAVLETGVVVVATAAGLVVALDREGTPLWQTRLDGGGGVRSTPAVGIDGSIYVSSQSGRITALDPEAGAVRWERQTGGEIRASPIVDRAGRIYVGSQDRFVYCLNPDGSLRWQRRLGGQIDSTGTIGPDGTYYCGCDDGRIYALR